MATETEPKLSIYRIDVDTYHQLAEAGALDGMDVELLDGLLIDKDSGREDPIHRIDVGTYQRMVASGVLEGRPIELLEGLLVEVSPQGPQHAAVIRRLTRHLAGAPAWLGIQLPLEAEWGSLPEPDLALTKHEPPDGHHPRTALLVVEVTATSHDQDRNAKARMYAHAEVPTYWLVDVPGRAVEVRTQPHPDGYERCTVYHEGSLVPSPLDGVADLDIAALFADFES
jgi:Uma2 family endonuclease